MGGEAVAHTDDISSWNGAASLVQQAVDTFGGLDVLINNAGILRDRMLFSMSEEEWDAVDPCPPQGDVRPEPSRRRLLAPAVQGRPGKRRPPHQHHFRLRALCQPGADQLRRGEGRHRGLHADRRPGARALRRHRQRDRPGAITRLTGGEGVSDEIPAELLPGLGRPRRHLVGLARLGRLTGHVIESSGRVLAVAEGWHRGPSTAPVETPWEAGAAIRKLLAMRGRARSSTKRTEQNSWHIPASP